MTAKAVCLPRPLRAYQVQDIEFLSQKGRAYLANEPGLGKTVEVLVALENLGAERVLVVGNKPSLGVWQDEASFWINSEALIYSGEPYLRRKILQDFLTRKVRFLVVNYSLVDEVVRELPRWEALVCDEIHKGGLLNRKTKTYKTIKSIKSKYLFLVTGTPIRQGPHDLWAPLHLIDPKQFSSYWKFVEEHCIVTKLGFRTTIEAQPKQPLELRKILREYMIHRRKRDVLVELPKKQRQPIKLELSKVQKRVYDKLACELMADTSEMPDVAEEDLLILAPNKATALLRLRQLLVTPKLLRLSDPGAGLEALPDLVDDQFSVGRSVAVCTPFRQAIPFIADALRKVTQNIYTIHGKLTAEQVRAASKAFQQLKTTKKALIFTIKSGTSFDAYEASTIFFLGAEWSAIDNKQAEDRLDRLGQKQAVTCYYILYPGTVDDEILEKLNHKHLAENWVLRPKEVLDSFKKILNTE